MSLKKSKSDHIHSDLRKVPRKDGTIEKKTRLNRIRDRESKVDVEFDDSLLDTNDYDEEC